MTKKIVVYEERSKEGREKGADVCSIAFVIIMLALIGFSGLIYLLKGLFNINGIISGLLVSFGSMFVVFVILFIIYLVMSGVFYYILRFRKIEKEVYNGRGRKTKIKG